MEVSGRYTFQMLTFLQMCITGGVPINVYMEVSGRYKFQMLTFLQMCITGGVPINHSYTERTITGSVD